MRSTRLLALVLVAAAAAAAVALNVLLLGRASPHDSPAGRLRPAGGVPTAPDWTVRPTTGRIQDEGSDD